MEFALVAPLFFFLMFVIAETAMVFIAGQVLENAVFDTARMIRTGQAQQGTWPKPVPPACGAPKPACPAADAPMTKADFRREICTRMSIFLSCDSNFYLDVKSFSTFAEMDNAMNGAEPIDVDDKDAAFAAETYDAGDADKIVIVRAYYQWPINPVMGKQWSNILANGKLLIGSFAVFRNEPYDPSK